MLGLCSQEERDQKGTKGVCGGIAAPAGGFTLGVSPPTHPRGGGGFPDFVTHQEAWPDSKDLCVYHNRCSRVNRGLGLCYRQLQSLML